MTNMAEETRENRLKRNGWKLLELLKSTMKKLKS